MLETIAILAPETTPGIVSLALHWALLVGEEVGGERVALIQAGAPAPAGERVRRHGPSVPILLYAEDAETVSAALAASRARRLRWAFVLVPPSQEALSVHAAGLADLVVLPCVPTLADAQEVGNTVSLIEPTGTPAVLLLVDCAPGNALNGQTVRILRAIYPPPICPHFLHGDDDQDIHSTDRLDAREVAAAWRWVRSRLN